MDEELEEILSNLSERLTIRIESLEQSDEQIKDILNEFYSEKERFQIEFGKEITERYESRIEDVCMDLAILKKRLKEEKTD